MSDFPYHGLRPFNRDETDIFFGREQHTDDLIERLGKQNFLAVVGYSGSGKSSLVRTGLIPSLQAGFLANAGTHWRIAECRPSNKPFESLAQALVEPDALGSNYTTALMANQVLTRGSLSLHELLAKRPLENKAKLLSAISLKKFFVIMNKAQKRRQRRLLNYYLPVVYLIVCKMVRNPKMFM